jgi:hypothetical protein
VVPGSTYVRLTVGVEGQGEIGINVKVCMSCITTKGPALLAYIPKAVGLFSNLGFLFSGAKPAAPPAGDKPGPTSG